MSLFGTIEKVDIFPKQLVLYAYVKYKRLECAYKALEATQSIGQLLESQGQVKIYPSDPFRRNQIVGNADDSEKEDELLNFLPKYDDGFFVFWSSFITIVNKEKKFYEQTKK